MLAYRRALALDPQQERARKNLEWIRAQALPAWAVEASEGGALDAFLFWHRRMTAAGCLLWGGGDLGLGAGLGAGSAVAGKASVAPTGSTGLPSASANSAR